MATTPPPASFLRIPPTPRHGNGYDQYEPYSTRQSARLATQKASAESRTTPPPSFPISKGRGTSRSTKKQKTTETESLSPPGSPMSPRKTMLGRRVATQIDDEDPFNDAKLAHSHRSRLFRTTMTEGMLPTPAKTPRKKPVDNAGSTARVLFPQPGQKKKKKQTGFSLDSFSDDPSQGDSIQIYTDSRDRIPEVDESEENPFYQKPSTNTKPRPSRPMTRSRDKEVNEALKREDGMVYVFRGKKMFRKFSDDVFGSDDEDDDDDLGLLASRPDLLDSGILENARPLTRSSIKPRVLFPSAREHVAGENNEEEEAATDIEDQFLDHTEAADDLDLIANVHPEQRLDTPPPKSDVSTPPSPGVSVRSLRSRSKRELGARQTPTASDPTKKPSPFDGWLRKKQTPPVIAAKTKKRDAESAGGPAPKKTRGNRAIISPS
ncbi:hypothetical protein AN4960.2 [Aspergillus nidulans FGSC A4]|uniref:Uncharacterized protein n=1 Tax=Emericella nidulans (strain FGSC A4 / ATCC 38163 / CBS 112.46 / NRRL 194 / M139) TaxID=227321 RepID=Q5B3C0_EMENI|nr:hypothetical protein [Aspergillus nidulans FGSC A4]EAA61038.1 hypothetical protein AN4960.2 [Aspergillus nidulans FGSC A4]CBF76392.1 TPA: conserved hypothetical protein [Aspergillus nidulans FGSC A4]|eukprot:XP_662564.1 hypothetical protein AN4960.2 [Aspergillus nidulans FGSC A4]